MINGKQLSIYPPQHDLGKFEKRIRQLDPAAEIYPRQVIKDCIPTLFEEVLQKQQQYFAIESDKALCYAILSAELDQDDIMDLIAFDVEILENTHEVIITLPRERGVNEKTDFDTYFP